METEMDIAQAGRRRAVVLVALVALLAGVLTATNIPSARAVSTSTYCAPVIVIGVRGSTEAAGTGTGPTPYTYASGGFGRTLTTAGRVVNDSTQSVRKEAIVYPALVATLEYQGSLATGVANLRAELENIASTCSSSRTVLIGFSQGAHVIGDVVALNELFRLSQKAEDQIAAIVLYANPTFRLGEQSNAGTASVHSGFWPRAQGQHDWLKSRIRSYCDEGDKFCACTIAETGTNSRGCDVAGQVIHDGTPAKYANVASAYIAGRLAISVPSGPSGGGSTPLPPGDGWSTTSDGAILQKVAKAGGYTGPVDGAPGANTWKGVQQVGKGYGYTGPIDGAPGTNTYMAFQRLAATGGYTGPIDGGLGANSWKGMQTVLRGFGYTGPIDGAPGTNTYAALQRLAKLGGYTGPVDGALGANTWRGLQRLFTGYGYTGPIDGEPGPNTFKALQRLAQLGGYTGPVDGVPGANTYAGLGKLVS
jgi:hypothetical protein